MRQIDILMFNANISAPNIKIGPEPGPKPGPKPGPTIPGLDAGRVGVLWGLPIPF